MRKIFAVSVFILATLTWSLAQNPGATRPSGQQPPSASPQAPDASQQTPPSAGAAQAPSQPGAQPQPQGQMPNAPITEGCLAGSDAGYTLTDKAGTTYKLNFPATANVSVLAAHVGESVKVMGDVTDAGKAGQSSINVAKIGRGTGTCSAGSSAQPQGSKPVQPQTPKP
jgi:hypothetical protein